MADINVERKQRSIWPLLLALLLIAAIGIAAWQYMERRDGDDDLETTPAGMQTSPDGTVPPATTTGY